MPFVQGRLPNSFFTRSQKRELFPSDPCIALSSLSCSSPLRECRTERNSGFMRAWFLLGWHREFSFRGKHFEFSALRINFPRCFFIRKVVCMRCACCVGGSKNLVTGDGDTSGRKKDASIWFYSKGSQNREIFHNLFENLQVWERK